ncbi:MAG TPA: adenine phosphoribosyltransferase [Acidobacteriota bacterium]|nr:adenine phosphoribosyltransferase [Acidobacteriota bacterium]
MDRLRQIIRDVPDFPKPGIVFKDITTLLAEPETFKRAIDLLAERYSDKGIDKVIGVESRGFIFGPAVAYLIGAGFVPVRKPGKLPAETISIEYELEYGTDTLEMHRDALKPGEKVIIIDDLIATGGTAAAVAEMVGNLGVELVEMAFLIELTFLEPRKKLEGLPVFTIIKF